MNLPENIKLRDTEQLFKAKTHDWVSIIGQYWNDFECKICGTLLYQNSKVIFDDLDEYFLDESKTCGEVMMEDILK